MNNKEIEKKYKINSVPGNLDEYLCKHIEQAYLNTNPVIRIRKENDEYYLTYKGEGLMVREEYNLPLDKKSYQHLKSKADGNVISKKRYLIPFTLTDSVSQLMIANPLTIELDIFDPPFAPLIIAEVEFPDLETANSFMPPDWFAEEVTLDPKYHNSNMSKMIF